MRSSGQLKRVVSFSFAGVILIILIAVLVQTADRFAWLSTALGLAVGWAAGILAAPYQSEQKRFQTYAKFAGAFISGWAASKVDRVVDLYLDPMRGRLILTEAVGLRVLAGATAFTVAMVTTYVGRKYVSFGPEKDP